MKNKGISGAKRATLHALVASLMVICVGGCSSTDSVSLPPAPFNLGFEQPGDNGGAFDWYAGGGGPVVGDLDDYTGTLDSKVVHSGKFSLHLHYVKNASGQGFGVGTQQEDVLSAVRGKTIRYSGWIKTENVSDFAGLWWRVDGADSTTLAFNNMSDSAVNGTRDWQQYSFELPVPSFAKNIDFGVLMVGTGDAWFDDLAIDTNGHPFVR